MSGAAVPGTPSDPAGKRRSSVALQLSSLVRDSGKAWVSKASLSFDGEGSRDKFDTRKPT